MRAVQIRRDAIRAARAEHRLQNLPREAPGAVCSYGLLLQFLRIFIIQELLQKNIRDAPECEVREGNRLNVKMLILNMLIHKPCAGKNVERFKSAVWNFLQRKKTPLTT